MQNKRRDAVVFGGALFLLILLMLLSLRFGSTYLTSRQFFGGLFRRPEHRSTAVILYAVRLPRMLTFAEEAVKQAVKATVSRGKVDVYISVRSETEADVQVTLNKPVVEGYLAAMRQMVTEYGVKDDISVSTLSRMSDVFVVDKPKADEDQLKADLLSVVEKALQAYDAMRITEGLALENDLRSRAATILELVAQVEEQNPKTVSDYRKRLEEKMREVLENKSIDESRILTEAAIFADKVAVDEEIVRLRSHFDEFDKILENGGAVGKNMDYLLQEMNREVNTTGSKANDADMAHLVVNMKSELEKIREQIQNLE